MKKNKVSSVLINSKEEKLLEIKINLDKNLSSKPFKELKLSKNNQKRISLKFYWNWKSQKGIKKKEKNIWQRRRQKNKNQQNNKKNKLMIVKIRSSQKRKMKTKIIRYKMKRNFYLKIKDINL